jgi:PPP family 3-phenylpropionic acid transporter
MDPLTAQPRSAPRNPSPGSPPGDVRSAPSPGGLVRPAIVYATLFGAVGAFVPYIAIYLSSTGLDLGTVGALIALHAAVSLVAAPSWGALADGIGDVRGPVLAAGLLAALAAGLLAIAVAPPALALGMILLAAASAGIIPLVDSRAVRMAGQRDRFGRARAWGSAAFVLVAVGTGVLIGRTGPAGMFLLYAPLLAVTGVTAWALLRLPEERLGRGGRRRGPALRRVAGMALTGLSPATILGVLRQPRLGVFFLAATVIWTSHAALQGFVSLRVVALGGDATIVAATWSLGALVEVPLMLAFPGLARRLGPERLIVVGAFAFGLRALLTALVPSAELIVAAALFGGVGFAFVYLGTVSWVAGSVRREVQATAQGIFSGTSVSIGAIGGSILGGAIGGRLGLPALFLIAAVGYATGAVLVWIAIGRSAAASRQGA